MISRQRLLTAIRGCVPDQPPVTTHHVMPYFLKAYMGGIDLIAELESVRAFAEEAGRCLFP